jgi:hypothetical protein
MKNFLQKLFAFVFAPALLYLHFVTQHDAFLFIYGMMMLVIVFFISVGIVAILNNQGDAKLMNSMIKASHTLSRWKFVVSGVYNLSALTYLLYVGAFFTASLLVTMIIAISLYFTVLWPLRQYTPLDNP